ncbi:Calpain-type cysteine protease dek1 [Irineochytrium annulatum]|nr:Calpain-type cysteine protease dek1 [Irineochytrium annulatum]
MPPTRPPDCDESIWLELPDDIQIELAAQYEFASNATNGKDFSVNNLGTLAAAALQSAQKKRRMSDELDEEIITPDAYDAAVWAALPKEMQLELGTTRKKRRLPNDSKEGPAEEMRVDQGSTNLHGVSEELGLSMPTGWDREVWNALPEEMQWELGEKRKRDAEGTLEFTMPAGYAPEIWAALPEELRVELGTPAFRQDVTTEPPRKQITAKDVDVVEWAFDRAKPLGHLNLEPALKDWEQTKPVTIELEMEERISDFGAAAENGRPWTDLDFPPHVSSLDGIASTSTEAQRVPTCKCGNRARMSRVSKENKNQGRAFFRCAKEMDKGSCGFFCWAGGEFAVAHSKKDLEVKWKRLTADDGYVVVRDEGFIPADVCQGSVGDCWFMSALSVVAERSDLIDRIMITKQPSPTGMYLVRLFIDGQWRQVAVDDNFALRPPNLKRSLKDDHVNPNPLLFCRANRKQLWVALIEKAYAKVHGSYHAISGGQIYEGMLDLTGYPTEAIIFSSLHFDSEVLWARLLSFHHHRFLVGAACPASGEGLVGSHAYSILESREVHGNFRLGRQKKIEEFFGKAVKEDDDGTATSLRLLKIRNPWGRVAWTGKFSPKSEVWTPELRNLLDYHSTSDDGIFWISYHDFLQRFIEVDVCFAKDDYTSMNLDHVFPVDSSIPFCCHELTMVEPSWLHFSICQPNKRGKAYESYFYSDVSVAILRVSPFGLSLEDIRLFGPGRASHFDVSLPADGATFFIVPFSLNRELFIREGAKKGLKVIGAGGGIAKPEKREVEFVIRLMSSNPLLRGMLSALLAWS